MNGTDTLEDRLRDALARRAAATTVGEPRSTAAVELRRLASPAPPRHRGRWLIVGASLATAAVAVAVGWVLAVDDGTTDGTAPGPPATVPTGPSGAAPPGTLLEYAATTLPDGYEPLARANIGGDVLGEAAPQRFGTNCLDWHLQGGGLVCDRIAAARSRHYGRAHTGIGVTVTTFLNAPFPVVAKTGRPATVQGATARLERGTDGRGPRLYWEPHAGVAVVLEALDPAVTEDDLRTIAEGLRPTELPAPDDMAYAVARLDLPADTDAATGTRTAYLWDRPAPHRCNGGLLDDTMLTCRPIGASDPLASLGDSASTVVGGSVSSAVRRVEIETADGATLDATLIDPGAPFTDRVFLTAVGSHRPTAVVALDANGTELARHALSSPPPRS
jgi:hypothetical protein